MCRSCDGSYADLGAPKKACCVGMFPFPNADGGGLKNRASSVPISGSCPPTLKFIGMFEIAFSLIFLYLIAAVLCLEDVGTYLGLAVERIKLTSFQSSPMFWRIFP